MLINIICLALGTISKREFYFSINFTFEKKIIPLLKSQYVHALSVNELFLHLFDVFINIIFFCGRIQLGNMVLYGTNIVCWISQECTSFSGCSFHMVIIDHHALYIPLSLKSYFLFWKIGNSAPSSPTANCHCFILFIHIQNQCIYTIYHAN